MEGAMRLRMKSKCYAVAGIIVGGVGFASALWSGHRLTVAFCGLVYGSTLTMCLYVLRGRL